MSLIVCGENERPKGPIQLGCLEGMVSLKSQKTVHIVFHAASIPGLSAALVVLSLTLATDPIEELNSMVTLIYLTTTIYIFPCFAWIVHQQLKMFTKKLIELRNRRARNGPRSTRKPARVQVVLSVNHNINDDLNSAVENIMGIMELGSSEQGYYISPLKSLAGTTSRYTLASHLRIFRGRQNVSRQASGVFMVAACFIFAGPIVAVNSVSWPKVVTSLSGVGSLMCGLVSVQTAGNHEIPDGWKIGVRVNHYILFVGFVFLYSEFFNRTKNGRQAFFEFVGKVTAAFFAHKWMSGFGCLTNTETSMVTSLDSFVWLDYLVLILMTTAIAYILVQQRVAGDAPMRPGPESEEPASEEPFPEEPAAESSVEEEVEVR